MESLTFLPSSESFSHDFRWSRNSLSRGNKKRMSQKREMTVRNQRFSIVKQPIASVLNQHLIDYPTPSNLSYWWGFGSLAGICLVIQIMTGIFLAMHYMPHADLAFNKRLPTVKLSFKG
ncbi:hypothetical protein C5167_011418 [Papaver somniferum]|uniref:Cytochrome b/b6 N-terminal region profile domain-containing protein n=1 Tax=Papaver somniferum TaxID=3469 RepID=A0A4Y7K485_PAPSO|nr:hypothetical protein C5167_011418 [Papaver somniferum]